jgi:hypothetical protein
MLNIPISLVLTENTSDEGTSHSWTVVNYILHAKLLGTNGGDDDPLPPDGGNPHPLPNLPFGGIWDADFVHDVPPAEQHVQAPEIPMVNTPPQAAPAADIQPMIEAVDSFNALHAMVQNVLDKAPEILNAINPTVITGAKVEFVDVGNGANSERKCMLRIFAVTAAPKESSSVSITEISEPDDPMLLDFASSADFAASVSMNQQAHDTTQPANADETTVRRSKRIATINAGYKNASAKECIEKKEAMIVKKNKKGKNKSSDYTAMIIDDAAPPPPELPLGTIQAIATKRCQVPPSEVTEEALTSTSG